MLVTMKAQTVYAREVLKKDTQVEVPQDVASRWVARGLAELAEVKEKTVDDMTVKELQAYAEQNGIDITGLTKKPEILQKIKGE